MSFQGTNLVQHISMNREETRDKRDERGDKREEKREGVGEGEGISGKGGGNNRHQKIKKTGLSKLS